MRHPPGKEIYRKGTISVFEVDGKDHKVGTCSSQERRQIRDCNLLIFLLSFHSEFYLCSL